MAKNNSKSIQEQVVDAVLDAPRRPGRPPGSGRVSPVPGVPELEAKITAALEAQNTWSPSLAFAVRMCAINYYAVLKVQHSIEKRAKVQYSLLTREGSTKYELFPDLDRLPALIRVLKESLKSLGLTLDTLEQTENDPLDELSDKVNGLLNG